MDRRKIYIAISILILILIGGLIIWTIFIGNAQRELQRDTEDLGYFEPSAGGGVIGGLFGTDDFDTGRDQPSDTEPAVILQQLYNLPQAGAVLLSSADEPTVRFVDRATGHVFEKGISEGTTKRILQTTIPKVYEALFTDKGSGVIRRYLDETGVIVSVYDVLNGTQNEKSAALEYNVTQMTVSPQGEHVFYLVPTAEGVRGVVARSSGDEAETLWLSGLRGWIPTWINTQSVSVSQKSSGDIPGNAFMIDTTTGEEEPLIMQIKGLIVLPSEKFILYSRSTTNTPTLWVYNRETRETKHLEVATFAEKCAWSSTDTSVVYCALPNTFPNTTYPDAWYQGKVHFADSFWKINVENGTLEELLAPVRTHSASLDAVELLVDHTDSHIVFKNNTDQTLWALTLVKESSDEEDTP